MKKSDCYFGIYPVRFIWHGAWADPELMYKGHVFNFYDIERRLFEMCKEDDPNAIFEDWMYANGKRVKAYLDYRISLSK